MEAGADFTARESYTRRFQRQAAATGVKTCIRRNRSRGTVPIFAVYRENGTVPFGIAGGATERRKPSHPDCGSGVE